VKKRGFSRVKAITLAILIISKLLTDHWQPVYSFKSALTSFSGSSFHFQLICKLLRWLISMTQQPASKPVATLK